MRSPSAPFHVDDATFVRAPVDLVYRRLTDIGAWNDWWPGARVQPRAPLAGDERWALSLATGTGALLRLGVTCVGWRHDAGLDLHVEGDLRGRVEFWFDPSDAGTVIHHLAVVTPQRRWSRAVETGYRRAVRRGLWGFKDARQLEMRTAIGLRP